MHGEMHTWLRQMSLSVTAFRQPFSWWVQIAIAIWAHFNGKQSWEMKDHFYTTNLCFHWNPLGPPSILAIVCIHAPSHAWCVYIIYCVHYVPMLRMQYVPILPMPAKPGKCGNCRSLPSDMVFAAVCRQNPHSAEWKSISCFSTHSLDRKSVV